MPEGLYSEKQTEIINYAGNALLNTKPDKRGSLLVKLMWSFSVFTSKLPKEERVIGFKSDIWPKFARFIKGTQVN